MLSLQIHPVKPLIKSINHDLDFNASFFSAKRCICEYIKSGRCFQSATVEVRSLRFWEARNVRHGGDVRRASPFNLHTNHCVQASYQDRFNLFHKRF
uniref:Uncharacterized protein n=1 Tax=Brassica oleracea TaxID=3712 RepID=A0A3P6DD93_BRAOL|nr:unnamed protein product [Brassica oleracea]